MNFDLPLLILGCGLFGGMINLAFNKALTLENFLLLLSISVLLMLATALVEYFSEGKEEEK